MTNPSFIVLSKGEFKSESLHSGLGHFLTLIIGQPELAGSYYAMELVVKILQQVGGCARFMVQSHESEYDMANRRVQEVRT